MRKKILANAKNTLQTNGCDERILTRVLEGKGKCLQLGCLYLWKWLMFAYRISTGARFLTTQLSLLLASHDALWALIQLVFRKRDGQFQQELLVNGLQIVERHSLRINYGIQNIVERVKILLQTELIEELAETQWRTGTGRNESK